MTDKSKQHHPTFAESLLELEADALEAGDVALGDLALAAASNRAVELDAAE